jgi:hypothetical protein
MVSNDVYGVWRKSIVPFKKPEEILEQLKKELVNGFEKLGLDSNDYEYERISKQYEEFGCPTWSLAIKAKRGIK